MKKIMNRSIELIIAISIMAGTSCTPSDNKANNTSDSPVPCTTVNAPFDGALISLAFGLRGDSKISVEPLIDSEIPILISVNSTNSSARIIRSLPLEEDCSFTALFSQTVPSYVIYKSSQEEYDKLVESIKRRFRDKGYVFDSLLIELFERNKQPVSLRVQPPLDKDYFSHYETRYHQYFEKGDSGKVGREKLLRDHPNFRGFRFISLPAYDPKTRNVLIYSGGVWGPESGGGSIRAFRYENGKLIPLASILLWKS